MCPQARRVIIRSLAATVVLFATSQLAWADARPRIIPAPDWPTRGLSLFVAGILMSAAVVSLGFIDSRFRRGRFAKAGFAVLICCLIAVTAWSIKHIFAELEEYAKGVERHEQSVQRNQNYRFRGPPRTKTREPDREITKSDLVPIDEISQPQRTESEAQTQ